MAMLLTTAHRHSPTLSGICGAFDVGTRVELQRFLRGAQ
jgi:hypothetical protein